LRSVVPNNGTLPDMLNAEYAHIWFCNVVTDGVPNYFIQYAFRNETSYDFTNTCPDDGFLVTASVPIKPRFNITGYVTFPRIQATGVVYSGLPNAIVRTDDNSTFAVTDDTGFYTLTSLLKGTYNFTVYPASTQLFTANFTVQVTNSSVQQPDIVVSRGPIFDFQLVLEYDPSVVGYEAGDLAYLYPNLSEYCYLTAVQNYSCCGGYYDATNLTSTSTSNSVTFLEQDCPNEFALAVAIAAGDTLFTASLQTELDGTIFSFSRNPAEETDFVWWRLFWWDNSQAQLYIANNVVGFFDLFNYTGVTPITWGEIR